MKNKTKQNNAKLVIKTVPKNEINIVAVLLLKISFFYVFTQGERFVTTPRILLASSGWRSGVDKHL